MNTITVPVSLRADDPFAENARTFTLEEVAIEVSDELKVRLDSADKTVASRAFDDLEVLIKARLESLGLGGIEFDFG